MYHYFVSNINWLLLLIFLLWSYWMEGITITIIVLPSVCLIYQQWHSMDLIFLDFIYGINQFVKAMVGLLNVFIMEGYALRFLEYHKASITPLTEINSNERYYYCTEPYAFPSSFELMRLPIESLIITNSYTQPCKNCSLHLSELHSLRYLSIGDNCFQYYSVFKMNRTSLLIWFIHRLWPTRMCEIWNWSLYYAEWIPDNRLCNR